MDIDQQIQTLIDQAPQDGTTPAAVQTIAPALKLVAEQLKHREYYILQTLEQNWVMTTLSHRTQPEQEKKVIYAFPTVKDAAAAPSGGQSSVGKDPNVMAFPLPVTHILFQMVAIPAIDSIVFFETPGNLAGGTEVMRQDLQQLIQLQLQRQQPSPLPPDIA